MKKLFLVLKVVEFALCAIVFAAWWWCGATWNGFIPFLIGVGLWCIAAIAGFLIGCAMATWCDDEDKFVPFALFNGWLAGWLGLIFWSWRGFGFWSAIALAGGGVPLCALVIVAIITYPAVKREDREKAVNRKAEKEELERRWAELRIGKKKVSEMYMRYNQYRRDLNVRYCCRNQMKYISDQPKDLHIVDEYLDKGARYSGHIFDDFKHPEKSYGAFKTVLLSKGREVALNILFYPDGAFQLECDGEEVCVNSWDECIRYLDAKNEV